MRGQGVGTGVVDERKAGNLGSAPDGDGGVAVFSDDGCVNRAWVDVEMFSEDVTEPLGVE